MLVKGATDVSTAFVMLFDLTNQYFELFSTIWFQDPDLKSRSDSGLMKQVLDKPAWANKCFQKHPVFLLAAEAHSPAIQNTRSILDSLG